MASVVLMPKVGQSVESCVLSEWYKKVGESVKAGESLFSFETDKSAFDEEAKESGTLLAAFFGEGDEVPCLTNIAVIGTPGESVEEFRPQMAAQNDSPNAGSAPQETTVVSVPQEPMVGTMPPTDREHVFVSPRARHLAEKESVNYLAAVPTGPNGRIVETDIRRLAAEGPRATVAAHVGMTAGCGVAGTGIGGRVTTADLTAAVVLSKANVAAAEMVEPDYVDVKLSSVRKATAKAMTMSLSTMAQLTHTTSFDASKIMDFRAQLKAASEKMDVPKITVNDMLIFAVSRVLVKHPEINSNYLDDKIRQFSHAHVGMAVDTPRGLFVPTIFNADTLSLSEIARESKRLVAACREGTIRPDEMKGASFTVSNLGSFGIEHFTPIVNPPQVAILGVDCTIDRVRAVNGQMTVYPAMGLSLTYDHRALDGAPASRFLQDLCTALENFYGVLI